MVDDHYLRDGVAPSYFVEGMLWNVPNLNFTDSHQKTIETSLAWLDKSDSGQLLCANNLHWLIRDGVLVCWNIGDYVNFLSTVHRYWRETDQ